MKHQQVVVDYWKMLKTSGLFLLLACSGYVLIKMVQTIFWLPRYLEKNQRKLEELAQTYSVNLKDHPLEKVREAQEEEPTAAAAEVEAEADSQEPKKDK